MLPPFDEFVKTFDFDKLSYDLNAITSGSLSERQDALSPEQQRLVATMAVSSALALMRQYHAWLSQRLR